MVSETRNDMYNKEFQLKRCVSALIKKNVKYCFMSVIWALGCATLEVLYAEGCLMRFSI